MLKKSLIGLIVVALAGGGYWYYDDYQKKEKVRLLKERDESMARMFKESREKEIKRQQEEADRKERIAQGLGKIENIVTYYDSGEKEEEYTLLEGKKDGKYFLWFKDGRASREAIYKDGFLIGERIDYYDDPNHTVSAISKYDRTDTNRSFGEHNTQWYKNGIKREESYKNSDQPEKEYKKYWQEDGTLKFETYFDSELKLTAVIYYYPSGQVRGREFEKNNKLQKVRTVWYESGQKYFEASYKDYMKQGTVTYWYESGQKYAEIEYDDWGYANGWCHQWNEKGEIVRKAFLKNEKEQMKSETVGYSYSAKCQEIEPIKGFYKIV